jgi:acetyl esterase/lipase
MTVLLIIGAVIAAIVIIFIIELLIAGLYPGVIVPQQKLAVEPGRTWLLPQELPLDRQDVSFDVNGTTVRAWFYLPSRAPAKFPCIIMANGLGGTREMALDAYASRFCQAGLAVLAFDYRHTGSSGGEPRQLLWIPCQLEDYAAAIKYARSRDEIDSARIALWGTSLSGGHSLVTAARDNSISCIAVQCPLIDGTAAAEEAYHHSSLRQVFRMAGHGQRDLVRSWLGLSPHKIPIVGKPGTIALMSDADAWETFRELAPEGFINEACARIAIRMDKYRPVTGLHKISCPVLLQVCDQDVALPSSVVARAATLLGQHAEVIHYPIRHFDIYRGDNLVRAAADQIDFFNRHLVSG